MVKRMEGSSTKRDKLESLNKEISFCLWNAEVKNVQPPLPATPKQDNPQNRQIWAHRGSESLNHQSGSIHKGALGFMPICYTCVSWSSCGTPKTGNRGCLYFCCLYLVPFPSTGLPRPALKGA